MYEPQPSYRWWAYVSVAASTILSLMSRRPLYSLNHPIVDEPKLRLSLNHPIVDEKNSEQKPQPSYRWWVHIPGVASTILSLMSFCCRLSPQPSYRWWVPGSRLLLNHPIVDERCVQCHSSTILSLMSYPGFDFLNHPIVDEFPVSGTASTILSLMRYYAIALWKSIYKSDFTFIK